MKYFIYFLSLLFFLGCSRKKTSLDDVIAESRLQNSDIAVNMPVIPGRHIDVLKAKPYADRILAFSIELGKRSTDFDKRMDVIIALAASRADWKEVVKLVTGTENYAAAARFNQSHLDSLLGIIHNPPDVFKESYAEMVRGLEGLQKNYAALEQCERYEKLPDLMEVILQNDLAVNQALRNFEKVIRAESNKKLPD